MIREVCRNERPARATLEERHPWFEQADDVWRLGNPELPGGRDWHSSQIIMRQRRRMHERLRTGSLRIGSAEGSMGSAEGDLTDQVTI